MRLAALFRMLCRHSVAAKVYEDTERQMRELHRELCVHEICESDLLIRGIRFFR